MLHNVFYVFVGRLHPLMCANLLFTKLVAMMAKAFLHCRLYAFLTLSFAVDGGGASELPAISQRSLVANTISNLNL